MPKLTDVAIQRLRAKSKLRIIYDTAATGLGLKVTAAGRKIWVLQLVYPGQRQQSRRTLGQYPGLGLADARARAAEWYGLVKQGVDPEEHEAEQARKLEAARRVEALKDASTFGAFAERYCSQRASNRRALADAREIRRNLVAAWADRPVRSITPRDVKELITRLKLRAPWEARNTWTHVVQIFKSAVFEELIEASPAASLDKRMLFKNARLAPRQRVLTDAELRALWRASEGLGYPYCQFYRLLVLTGGRVSEVAHARWREIDLGARLWTIPAERYKSDAVHLVPLSGQAVSVLEALPRLAACEFLLTTTGTVPINGFSKAKAQLDIAMSDELGGDVAHFVNHDIRRTFRTRLSELRVPDPISELCIGHARTGLAGVYDRHKYIDERREAFELWAARLREIVEPPPTEPSKVVALDARRKAI